MPHIGIERLRAGDAEKDRAQHQKSGDAIGEQVMLRNYYCCPALLP